MDECFQESRLPNPVATSQCDALGTLDNKAAAADVPKFSEFASFGHVWIWERDGYSRVSTNALLLRSDRLLCRFHRGIKLATKLAS